jgi:hypothetical protein
MLGEEKDLYKGAKAKMGQGLWEKNTNSHI